MSDCSKTNSESLIKEVNKLLNCNLTRRKIHDFFSQRNRDEASETDNVSYFNLSTRRLVGEKTAHAKGMSFVDDEQRLCMRGKPEDKVLFDRVVQIFASLSDRVLSGMTPPSSPKEETRNEDKEEKTSGPLTEIEKFLDMVENSKGNESKRSPISATMRAQVWGHSGGICHCCSTSITESFFECGHVTAHKFHGGDGMDNLRAICQACNDEMGVMHMYEFALSKGFTCRASEQEQERLQALQRESKMLLRLLHALPLGKEYQRRIEAVISSNKRYYYTDRLHLIKLCVALL